MLWQVGLIVNIKLQFLKPCMVNLRLEILSSVTGTLGGAMVKVIPHCPAGTVWRPNRSWTNIICSGPSQSWTNPEPWLNGSCTNLADSFSHRSVMVFTGSFGHHSVMVHIMYVRIRSHFGSAEPILNQKCLQGEKSGTFWKNGITLLKWSHFFLTKGSSIKSYGFFLFA